MLGVRIIRNYQISCNKMASCPFRMVACLVILTATR